MCSVVRKGMVPLCAPDHNALRGGGVLMCPTRAMIRNLSIFFAIVFGLFFIGFVIDAASGGSPKAILHSMLVCEVACGFFIMSAVAVDPRKVD